MIWIKVNGVDDDGEDDVPIIVVGCGVGEGFTTDTKRAKCLAEDASSVECVSGVWSHCEDRVGL